MTCYIWCKLWNLDFWYQQPRIESSHSFSSSVLLSALSFVFFFSFLYLGPTDPSSPPSPWLTFVLVIMCTSFSFLSSGMCSGINLSSTPFAPTNLKSFSSNSFFCLSCFPWFLSFFLILSSSESPDSSLLLFSDFLLLSFFARSPLFSDLFESVCLVFLSLSLLHLWILLFPLRLCFVSSLSLALLLSKEEYEEEEGDELLYEEELDFFLCFLLFTGHLVNVSGCEPGKTRGGQL